MESNIVQNRTKRLQTIITIGLVLVLAAIVAGYVYVGMKRATPVVEPVTETAPTSTIESTESELTDEEKAEILRQLAAESTTTVPEAEKQKIIENLQKPSVDPVVDEPIDMAN